VVAGFEWTNYYHFSGYIALWAELPGVFLSQEECRSVSANPWQIFEDDDLWIPFSVAGGGASAVTGDLDDSYVIRAAIHGDFADSYAIRSAIVGDLADSYAIRALASQDLADSYIIRSAASQDFADSYIIRAAASQDLADSYNVRAAISGDLADSYEIQSAGVVTSDLADSYVIRAPVAADVADSYSIRATATSDLDDSFIIRGLATKDLADSYTIITAIAADLADTYSILEAGGGTCPTATQVANAVWAHATAALLMKLKRNKAITDPATGIMTIYDDDGVTPLVTANVYEDAAAGQAYRGRGAERRERLQ
jgi:hypothetical protein